MLSAYLIEKPVRYNAWQFINVGSVPAMGKLSFIAGELFLVVLLLLGVITLSVATKPEASVSRVQTGYRYAYAKPGCSPWDGPAIKVILQQEPLLQGGQPAPEVFPHYNISLWQSMPEQGRWYHLDQARAGSNQGHIAWCASKTRCETRYGRVRFTRVKPESLRGELRIRLNKGTGRERVFPFSAPVRSHRFLCG